jgi:PmbA protein
MGDRIFAPGIAIIDEPHRLRGLGSRPFDGEGVANAKRTMVEDGVLTSWFLDLRSANQLGLQTTGHAVRGLGGGISPSSTNLYMQPGSVTSEDLISDIADGFYVTEAFGMGVNLITGDYSQGASGFWIENGKLTYPVSELTIAGHLSDMFARMIPASDLEFRYATNVPTLRIDGMTIAGT